MSNHQASCDPPFPPANRSYDFHDPDENDVCQWCTADGVCNAGCGTDPDCNFACTWSGCVASLTGAYSTEVLCDANCDCDALIPWVQTEWTACDDLQSNTTWDVYNDACVCIWTYTDCDLALTWSQLPWDDCDYLDPWMTTGAVYDNDCNCIEDICGTNYRRR